MMNEAEGLEVIVTIYIMTQTNTPKLPGTSDLTAYLSRPLSNDHLATQNALGLSELSN